MPDQEGSQIPLASIIAKMQEQVGAMSFEIAALKAALEMSHGENADLRAILRDQQTNQAAPSSAATL